MISPKLIVMSRNTHHRVKSLNDEFAILLKSRKEVTEMSRNMSLIFIHDHLNDIPWNWIAISERDDVWDNNNSWFRKLYEDALLDLAKMRKK